MPPQTVREALDACVARLMQADVYYGHGTDNAWDEAVQLVLYAAGLPAHADESVLALPWTGQAGQRLDAALERRTQDKVPAAYITGRAWFAGIEFRCDERALVPRSPLAELILDDFQPWYSGPGPKRVLDLCCGGGCIGLAVAYHYPQAQVDLLDIDPDALALARENAQLLAVDERVRIIQSDLFDGLQDERYDIILSNPPYVDAQDLAAMPAEYLHEPEIALGSGADGLDFTRRLLAQAAQRLEPHSQLIVEVGNSWTALEAAFSQVPFTWLEFEMGGHGVFTLSARELQDYSAYWRG